MKSSGHEITIACRVEATPSSLQAGAGDAIVARTSFEARRVEHRVKRRWCRFYSQVAPNRISEIKTNPPAD